VLKPAEPRLHQPLIGGGHFGFGVEGDAGPDYTIRLT
jgi:hypothetical protein